MSEQLPDGWIAHDGGPCPVPLSARVSVLHRDGTPRMLRQAGWWVRIENFAEHDLWRHEGPGHLHIIAYKPEPTP